MDVVCFCFPGSSYPLAFNSIEMSVESASPSFMWSKDVLRLFVSLGLVSSGIKPNLRSLLEEDSRSFLKNSLPFFLLPRVSLWLQWQLCTGTSVWRLSFICSTRTEETEMWIYISYGMVWIPSFSPSLALGHEGGKGRIFQRRRWQRSPGKALNENHTCLVLVCFRVRDVFYYTTLALTFGFFLLRSNPISYTTTVQNKRKR